MNGKNRCKILKEIRKKIADENGIEYAVSECKYKGDCLGTCPKCEAEVQYLEHELAQKSGLGKRVALAGIAAGITLAATGCTDDIKSKLGFGGQDELINGDIAEAYTESSEYCEITGEEHSEDSKVSDIIVDGEMVEVVGEMPESSLPEISYPYNDMMGDFVTFDVDINAVAEMDKESATEALDGWTREYIEYHWQKQINFRDSHITEFIVSGVAVIDVYFDEQGAVMKVIISAAEEPLMGDIPS